MTTTSSGGHDFDYQEYPMTIGLGIAYEYIRLDFLCRERNIHRNSFIVALSGIVTPPFHILYFDLLHNQNIVVLILITKIA